MPVISRPAAASVRRPQTDGAFRVVGTTFVIGLPNVPVSRRVRIHAQITGEIIRETWSNAQTAAYAFNWVKGGAVYVVALDHTGVHGGVIETDVPAEPMP